MRPDELCLQMQIVRLLRSICLGLLASFRHTGAVVGSEGLLPPTAEECPDCVEGTFRCPRTCTAPEPFFRMYHFDFAYHAHQCFEEIPTDTGSVMLDLDVWCVQPASQIYMDCYNMYTMAFTGINILGSCVGGAHDASLVRESCLWECKNGRPAARCIWEFDLSKRHDIKTRAEDCWLQERCGVGSQITVDVICSPIDGIVSQAVHDAAIKATNERHAEVAGIHEREMQEMTTNFAQEVVLWDAALRRERAAHNDTKEQLINVQGRLNKAREDTKDARDDNSKMKWGILGIAVLATCGFGAAVAMAAVIYKRRKAMAAALSTLSVSQVVVGRPVVPALDGDGTQSQPTTPSKSNLLPQTAWGTPSVCTVTAPVAPSRSRIGLFSRVDLT